MNRYLLDSLEQKEGHFRRKQQVQRPCDGNKTVIFEGLKGPWSIMSEGWSTTRKG